MIDEANASNFPLDFDATTICDSPWASSTGERPGLVSRVKSFFELAQVASVIGEDDRTTELYTKNIPERLVCSLEIRKQGRLYHGTGWMAGPRLVLTCGHNVHHDDFAGWADSIDVIPGRSEADTPFGKVTATRFSAHPKWVQSHDVTSDFGCIHLDLPVGDKIGWFAVAMPGPAQVGQPVVCSGYPDFDASFTRQRRGQGEVVWVDGRRLYHDVDTDNGESGSPIWRLADVQSPPEVFAVHGYEKVYVPAADGREANVATLIDADLYALAKQWRAVTP
ncbi:serine protease [Novosphingobium sp. CF614]|uniref:trypsin-like serine peptidase n=1 Tax=Novosphingobium sp. CF614 TaxID=1884364 RepID=UPI0011608D97|nr:trypsin-like peptidase domain-containing protein [Novosphingobium sp. CF614]